MYSSVSREKMVPRYFCAFGHSDKVTEHCCSTNNLISNGIRIYLIVKYNKCNYKA